ncbi:LysR family substrate-binding domain-containing protein [Microbacterium thalassium]|uniref:DNA-binding transcriptional LysR family regulator n=2 Tax=Microbacterium thalassium TaxID=362649 RepID=A0A7X0KUA7_9MICO|nr:LysR family substrate-binding domain-containing protein [Microbacterium thalassium]MBB6390934.1 DNA-binding transcriptional LysR family regulator [Microbacterium thalassium]
MAKRGGGPRKPPRGAGGAKRGAGAGRTGSASRHGGRAQRPAASAQRSRDAGVAQAPDPAPEGPFRLGAIPGATPGKWIDIWHERMPQVELVLTPVTVADQRRALADGEVDAALVRLPIADDEGLHVIPLYEEVPVVVASKDSHLTAADELDLADLAGEVIIVPRDDVLAVGVPGGIRPSFDPPEDTEQAIATAATGVGIVIVPMSLARLHRRKDAEYRPLRGGPPSPVGLAWPEEGTTPLVETFIGIVRGRTANSSRT